MYDSFDSIREDRQTFEDRIGRPDECTSALGHIIIGFTWLEHDIEKHILALAGLSSTVGSIVTDKMSFRTKVAVLSGLVQCEPPLRRYNIGHEMLEKAWGMMRHTLEETEVVRDTIVNTHWGLPVGEVLPSRETDGDGLDSGHILDTYDLILDADTLLNEFFLEPER